MCADHSAVASSIALVVNQRLVRRLCKNCSGAGCEGCLHTGYRGRLPAVECLRVTEEMRGHVAARRVETLAAKPSLADNARALVEGGTTNEMEIRRVFGFTARD
jgi:type II secretory ATPase GspE/PulE/Tfp pilus assembly ATPase PilB-like protein